MTLEEFINKNMGKKVDFDGAYGAQCVDLFRQYCKDVLNIPHTGSVDPDGAKALWLNYENLPVEMAYFERVRSSKTLHYGDVLVWDATTTNKYGHVAIFLGNTSDGVLVLEQDGFKQDGVKIKVRAKLRLLGALRSKK